MENNPKKGAGQKAGAGIRSAMSGMNKDIETSGPVIKLNFINQSNDDNNSDVVIFQKNVASTEEIAVAWQVIQYCGKGDNHPFDFTMEMAAAAKDSYGNYTPPLPAVPGQSFRLVRTTSGDQLQPNGNAGNMEAIEIVNGLSVGTIDGMVYRSGKVLGIKTGIAAQQKTAFVFQPTIWIGVLSQVNEGDIMNAAMLSVLNTEMSLIGIASADIVMTGGGSGPNAMPFVFTLQNVVMA
jgi:hypothetical protein